MGTVEEKDLAIPESDWEISSEDWKTNMKLCLIWPLFLVLLCATGEVTFILRTPHYYANFTYKLRLPHLKYKESFFV